MRFDAGLGENGKSGGRFAARSGLVGGGEFLRGLAILMVEGNRS